LTAAANSNSTATTSDHSKLLTADRVPFMVVVLQLITLTVFSYLFDIQANQGFPLLMAITTCCFLINAFIPKQYRPFLLSSAFAVTCVSTLGLVSGGFILAVSLCLFITLNLRTKMIIRIIIIALLFTGLMVLRNRWFFAPRAIIAVPYLGSLLAFRTISFLYHEKHNFKQGSAALKLSYFLMLPNLVFLLFPIIDFRNYVENYYSRPAMAIYKQGIYRISSGVLILFVHRIMYFYFSVDPNQVSTLPQYLHFTVISYLLIIQVVGIFITCTGWLTLFGFDLPKVFENFFFATGFSNLWRRINHYWRDFIIKVFYFPLFFRIRKIGHYGAMITAGLTAFFISWMLHSLQLYWISGHFSLSANDGIYWMTMGVFITADGIYQFRKVPRVTKRSTFTSILILGIRITGIFLFSALLWTFWNSDSVSAWWYVFFKAISSGYTSLIQGLLYILAGVFVLGIVNYYFKGNPLRKSPAMGITVPSLMMLAFVSLIAFQYYARSLPAVHPLAVVEENISTVKVNEIDREQVDLGYYDQLVDVGGIGRTGTQFRLFGDVNWATGSGATKATGDVLLRVFIPGAKVNHHGTNYDINSLGIRDREYSVQPDSGTRRWVFLGTSYVLGAGVEKESTFEFMIEKYLSDSLQKSNSGNLEILNYGMGGYMLTQQVALCREKAFESSPQAVFYFCHPGEADYVVSNIARLVSYGVSFHEFPFLDSIVQKSGVQQFQSRPEMISRLQKFKFEIVSRGYAEIVNSCRAHGAEAIWVFLPTTTDADVTEEYNTLSELATRSGFTTVNMIGVFDGYRKQQIQVGEPDTHANEFGNQLIAARFVKELRTQQKLLK
jgi:hypothetical protein